MYEITDKKCEIDLHDYDSNLITNIHYQTFKGFYEIFSHYIIYNNYNELCKYFKKHNRKYIKFRRPYINAITFRTRNNPSIKCVLTLSSSPRTRVPVPRYTHNCKCNSQHTFFRTSNQNLFLLSLDTHSNLRSMWNGKLENWKLPLPIQIGVEQIGNRQEVLNYYWEDLFVFAFRLTNQLLWLCK